MQTLFTAPTPPKEKVQDSNFKDYYPSISSNMAYDNLLPYISNAQDTYLEPILGTTFLNALIASNESDAKFLKVIHLARTALANFAVFKAMPHLNIILSGSGTNQNRTENTSPASQWAFKSARWSALQTAEQAIDNLISYLYKEKSFFTTWTPSQVFNTDFFKTIEDVKLFMPMRSIRAFHHLIPSMLQAEIDVKNLTGYREYDAILTKLDSTLKVYQTLLNQIRMYIIYKSLHDALPLLSVIVSGSDLTYIGETEIVDKDLSTQSATNQAAITRLMQKSKEQFESAKSSIKNTLEIHKDTFILYAADISQEYRSKSVFTSSDGVGGIML